MYGVWVEYVWSMGGVCMEYGWSMYGVWVEYVWSMGGVCMEYVRSMYGVWVEYVCSMYGVCAEYGLYTNRGTNIQLPQPLQQRI